MISVRVAVLVTLTVASLSVGPAAADRVVGTPQDDALRGTDAHDKLLGRAGNDRVFGLGGRDWWRVVTAMTSSLAGENSTMSSVVRETMFSLPVRAAATRRGAILGTIF